MWKDFFYLTKSERRGLSALLLLTIGAAGAIYLYSEYHRPEIFTDREKNEQAYQDFMTSVRRQDSLRTFSKQPLREQPVRLMPFDPNTADSATFAHLGLPPYVIRNILKYRAKGGRFHTPDAFARIYGLSDEQFSALLPYIRIKTSEHRQQTSALPLTRDTTGIPPASYTTKFRTDTVIDLNTADTALLKKIPGIGSGIARQIVAYRSRLGGFCRTGQLQELRHVPDSLNKWFYVEKGRTYRINLNKSSIERLKAHPYLDFYQAKVIVEHRKRKGKLKSLKQLALYEEFTPEDLLRLEDYVCFE